MKKGILIASLFVIAACSSKKKMEEPAPAPAVTEPAPAPVEKESMTMDSGSTDGKTDFEGGFPDVEGTERSGATCKMASDERMVSVIDTREGPCGVVYNKFGNKKTVAYAKHDMGFCDKVYENIIGNLTNGGFDCGGAGAASSEASSESTDAAASEEKAQ